MHTLLTYFCTIFSPYLQLGRCHYSSQRFTYRLIPQKRKSCKFSGKLSQTISQDSFSYPRSLHQTAAKLAFSCTSDVYLLVPPIKYFIEIFLNMSFTSFFLRVTPKMMCFVIIIILAVNYFYTLHVISFCVQFLFILYFLSLLQFQSHIFKFRHSDSFLL